MIDTKELRMIVQDFKLDGSPVFIQTKQMEELLDRLERAESECLEQARLNGMGSEREAALMAKLEAVEKERDALRSKIAEMGRQEPVAEWLPLDSGEDTRRD